MNCIVDFQSCDAGIPSVCLLGTSQRAHGGMLWFVGQGKMVSVAEEEDPRKAILRHGKDEFSAYTAAYKKTQPSPMFAEEEDDEEDS